MRILSFSNDVSFVLKHHVGFGSYTSLTAQCFSTAERTGSPIFIVLWSIAIELVESKRYIVILISPRRNGRQSLKGDDIQEQRSNDYSPVVINS